MSETSMRLYSFLAVALPLAALEVLIARSRGREFHEKRDSLCNLAIMAGGMLSRPLFAAYLYFSLDLIKGLAPLHLPDTLATAIAAVVATDFVYYWEHRLSHTNRWLWFFHEVHHSSRYFNLTTSFRLHWLGRLIGPVFFAPLVMLGFSPAQVTLFFVLNLFYQYFLHTQTVGKLPLVEGFLNTPSAHRVHHARNKEYLNRNFGGILMIWDRTFRTYQAETVAPKFGTIGRFESTNPFTVQFHKVKGYRDFAGWLTKKLGKGVRAV